MDKSTLVQYTGCRKMKFNPFANLRETAFQLMREMAKREFPNRDLADFDRFTKDLCLYAFDGKNHGHYDTGNWDYCSFLEFLSQRIFKMAKSYIDPDKAYDLVNYPQLDGWSKESLKEKLGDKFLEFSPFVPKWQYLVFMCEVFKLCHVKRFSATFENLSRSAAENSNEIKSVLKTEEFVTGGRGQGIEFSRDELDDDCYLSESKYSHSTFDPGKAEYKLYAYVTKGKFDTFDTFGALDVDGNALTENAWCCIPTNLNFESRIDSLPFPAHGESYSMGFTFEKVFAVCDYSAHFAVDNKE